jgi:PAS domain S-box-containing protein
MVGTVHDITERKQAEEALRKSEARFRSTLDNMMEGCQIIGFDWRYLYINQVAADHGRRSRADLLGRSMMEAYPGLEQTRLYAGLRQCMEDRLPTQMENEFVYPDGERAWFQLGIQPVPEGVFILSLDITQRKKAEEAIGKLNEELEHRVAQRTSELEAANKELEAFTYSVSHDLRAPLRHIDGFSRLLLDEYSAQLPEEARRYLTRVREGTLRMGQLVDDLLNLTRVGRQELRVQLTGLNSLLAEVRSGLQAETEGREIEWKVGSLPFVECDPALMKQVLANLLANAAKFTRPRSPAVIEVGTLAGNGGPTVFVRDNGVGFSMKYADKLFGVFQRLHRAEDFPGTGVGLATVRRIIHKHGGRIWAESELNKGATFYFTLGHPEGGETGNHSTGGGVG